MFRVLVISTLLLVFGAGFAFGKSTTWTGGTSTSWSDPANWSNGVPVAGDNVTIQNAANNPVLNTDISLASLNLSNNSVFTIADGISLDVTGIFSDANNGSSTLNVNNGTLTLHSAANIFGSINLGSGTINFLGDFTLSGILDVVDGTVNVGTSATSAVFEIKRGGEFNLNNGTLNVYGASTIKGSGALNVTSGAVNFYGTSTYNGQGILNAGSGDIYFAKDVTISGNGTINAESSTIIMDGSIWNMADNASNFYPGTSTVIFSGDAQLITGSNKQDITFYNLTIDPGANVTADIPVSVTNNYVNNGTFGPTPPSLSSNAVITQQPVSQEVCEGTSVSFSVSATGATGYQWQKNSVDISGATSSVLTISNVSQSDAAQYVCYVYGGGYVKSNGAVLSVNSLPLVSLTASSSAVCDGSEVALTASNSGGNVSTISRSSFPNIDIPDDNTAGISTTITLPAGSSIPSSADLVVSLTMEHSWVGDLKVTLTGPGGGSGVGETTIFDQPGVPASTWGNDQQLTSSGSYVFTTAATKVIPEISDGSTNVIPGEYLPSDASGASNLFSGINFPVSDASGTWTLKVYDLAWLFTGKIVGWSITVKDNGKYTTYFSGPGTISAVSYSGTYNDVATANATLPTAPGTYTYTATTSDPNGCSVTSSSVNVSVADPLILTATPTNADLGLTNGFITASATGGQAPYQFSLDSGPYQSSGDFTNLSPGTYTITVQDNIGCTQTSTVDVNEKPDTQAPQFTNCSSNITVTADPATCSASVWYDIPTATDNAGAFAGTLAGFDYLGDYNGHSYYISTDLQLSVDAHTTVFDNGGHLATITSAGENAFLSGFASARNQDVWFGFTDAAQEGTFRWVTGEPVSYTNWNTGEPNNSSNNEDWAEMYGTNPSINGKWNDQYNTDSRYFFLEFDGPRVIGEMQDDGQTTWQQAPAPGSTFATGLHHMRFTATDASGNTSICTFDINVTESEPPTITAPADVSAFADAGSCSATGVTLGNPITADNCGVASVTNDAPPSFPTGITTVTWTVTDNSGNTATATQKVTVTDDQAPSFGQSFANIQECAVDTSNQSFTINQLISAYSNPGYDRNVDPTLLIDNCTAYSSIQIEYMIQANNGTSDLGLISDWLTANNLDSYEFSYDNLKASFPTATMFHVYYQITDASNNSTITSFYITVDPVPKPGQIIPN